MQHDASFELIARPGKTGTDPELGISGIRPRSAKPGRFQSLVRLLVERVVRLFRRQRPLRAFGPYRLVERIGEGGMGVVYKATHRSVPGPVAIKLLSSKSASEGAVERFEREAELTRTLGHPNTVSVYGLGKTPEGTPYYVMEYLEGPDLDMLVRREGVLPPARVARVVAELASALQAVHEQGIVHGDVKPANAVLCRRGGNGDCVKLLDFGLARVMRGASDRREADADERIAGTPLYLAPEALIAPHRVDGRSDLYALGAVAYFLLTGVPPFIGTTPLAVFVQHLHAVPLPPSVRSKTPIPGELEAIVMSCLAKSPEQRPASAALLRERLLSFARKFEARRSGERCLSGLSSNAVPRPARAG